MGLSVQDGDEASPRSKRLAEAETGKALRKLDWERRWLAAQMKWDFTAEERLELFTEFGVSSDGKERKLQLVRKLWAPDTIRWAQLLGWPMLSQLKFACGSDNFHLWSDLVKVAARLAGRCAYETTAETLSLKSPAESALLCVPSPPSCITKCLNATGLCFHHCMSCRLCKGV